MLRLLIRGTHRHDSGYHRRALKIAPSTLSAHLAQLERTGLATPPGGSRIFYAVEIEGMRRLLRYLIEECCGGHPELCEGLRTAADFCTAGAEPAAEK